MEQFHLFAQLLAAGFQKFQRAADVNRRFKDRLIVQRLHPTAPPAGTIAGHSGNTNLDAHITEPLRQIALGRLDQVLYSGHPQGVGIGGLAAFAAHQLINRMPA